MLIGGGVRLLNSNPMRVYGAPLAGVVDRSNWLQTGAARSGLTGLNRQVRTNGSRKFISAVPNGYGPGVAWVLPTTAGGMSSRNEVTGFTGLTAAAALGVNLSAAITSQAVLTAVGQLVVAAQAAIAGNTTVSANIVAALQMAANLAASGDVTGTLSGIGSALASVSGATSITATLTAVGNMAASIEVGGVSGELTAPQIANEILDAQLVETGLSVRETLRLCVAALAGKVSGAPGTTITIRNAVQDSKDRIVATVDANGNRTAITYDVE